jgi:hypothetical protein
MLPVVEKLEFMPGKRDDAAPYVKPNHAPLQGSRSIGAELMNHADADRRVTLSQAYPRLG